MWLSAGTSDGLLGKRRRSLEETSVYAAAVLVRRFATILLLSVVVAGCGSDSDPGPVAVPPSGASSTATSADSAGGQESAQDAAVQTAKEFLAALVAEDFDAAYALLSPSAQAGITLDDFAAARRAKANSARSLGQRYELTDATGGPAGVTVTGNGRLADGTAAVMSLPLVMVDSGWRVDAVPTNF